jgi:hypothetical protein
MAVGVRHSKNLGAAAGYGSAHPGVRWGAGSRGECKVDRGDGATTHSRVLFPETFSAPESRALKPLSKVVSYQAKCCYCHERTECIQPPPPTTTPWTELRAGMHAYNGLNQTIYVAYPPDTGQGEAFSGSDFREQIPRARGKSS